MCDIFPENVVLAEYVWVRSSAKEKLHSWLHMYGCVKSRDFDWLRMYGCVEKQKFDGLNMYRRVLESQRSIEKIGQENT